MSGGEVLGQAARGSSARNAPCPCGSGKKYKLCCLRKDEARVAVQPPLLSVEQVLREGLAFHQRGDIAQAMLRYRQALEREPHNPDALHLLGIATEQQGNHHEAVALLRHAVARKGTVAEYRRSLAVALRSDGALPEAIACLQDAVRLYPGDALAHCLLGEMLAQEHDWQASAAAYRSALQLEPQNPVALRDLGNVLGSLGDLEGALQHYRAALPLAPSDPDLHQNLGLVLEKLGMYPDSLYVLRHAVQLRPQSAVARLHLASVHQAMCLWDGLDSLWSAARSSVLQMSDAPVQPFTFLTLPSDRIEQLCCAEHWASTQFAQITQVRGTAEQRGGSRARERLHIGYLSADFHEHATSSLLAEVLERHDRRRVTISAYALDGDDGSAMRQRLVGAVDQWVDLSHATHAAAAARIAADEVDILVDLKGYTFQARTEIVALRPAPVQVNYLGYPGTMGAPFIDYLVADEFVIPPAHLGQYRERVAYLPVCYQPNDRQRRIAATPTRAACGLPERGVVLCSFSGTYKITPAVYAVWLRLLGAVPESVLWLLASNAWAMANLRAAAAAAGVAPERVVFAPRLAGPEHLARQRVADLFLDTHPVTGHTTCSDALWAGLPVVTCAGGTFVSRVAGSLLRAVGLPELVTESLAAYEAVALELAREPDRLGAVRARLAANRLTSPLFDSAGYTVALEGLYEGMWAAYVRTGQPAGDSRDPLRGGVG